MSLTSNQPIGIFDSGVGGLTVAHAIVETLPNENIVYFGDTAHLPYGDKSAAAIQAYSVKITHMLLERNCKMVVIACNTASALAYDLLKEYVGKKALLENVIDPVVNYLKEQTTLKNVGLIGTNQTIHSNIYKKKCDEHAKHIQLHSLETPLLVPAIEEGFIDNNIIEMLLKNYLSNPVLNNIESLILGCTHYPVIKNEINKYYDKKIIILDSAQLVAQRVQSILSYHRLLNNNAGSERHFYVSDITDSFKQRSKFFFGEDIKLEQYPLWE